MTRCGLEHIIFGQNPDVNWYVVGYKKSISYHPSYYLTKKWASYKLGKQRESWQSSLYEKQKTQLTDM